MVEIKETWFTSKLRLLKTRGGRCAPGRPGRLLHYDEPNLTEDIFSLETIK
jgi:hypothetical protein